MDHPPTHNGSPYIGDIALQPPSPPIPAPFDLGSPGFPSAATYPSSAASYHNSPYSNHSELSFGDEDPPLSLFDDKPSDSRTDYNPREYDNSAFGSLLMFNDTEYMPQYDHQAQLASLASSDYRRGSFDHGSPSSNGGAESGGENGGYASRRSSVSSHQFSPSPRMDMAQSFENLTFTSPHWGTEPLPRDGRTPDIMQQQPKAPSPPRLMMPDNMSSGPSHPDFPAPPMINAPDDDGTDTGGPSVRIVPATPISGGGSGVANVPFQTTLQTLNQGTSLQPQQQPQPRNWDVSHQQQGPSSDSLGPYGDYSHDVNGSTASLHNGSPSSAEFLFNQPRSRSKSDTSLEPPNWDNSGRFLPNDSALDDNVPSFAPNDRYGSHSPSPSAHQTTFAQSTHGLNPHYSFGPPTNAHGSNMQALASAANTGYLSPDMNGGLRRAKSDNRPSHVRQSRSDDLRPHLFPSPDGFLPGQYLSPQDPMNIGNIAGGGMAGSQLRHYRRASSGTRSERGVSAGTFSAASSGRGSPYPSPNVSPRVKVGDLPSDDGGLNSVGGGNVPKPNVTTGRTANASHKRRKQEATFVCPVPGCGSTFTRSFNLKGHIRSHNEEKPFQCHWPGCGKGFARQHDCKRHEQLHTNYRPFNCDGCHKQFARMDALNRHLRSEGGAECKRILEASGTLPNLGEEGSRSRRGSHAASSRPTSQPKIEPDLWTGVTV